MIARTISAAWVKGITEVLEASGLNVDALFKEVDMDRAAMSDPHARYATEKINMLWELAAERLGNPAIGLARPEVTKPAIFDVVAYAMMSCSTLLASLERLAHYLRIVSKAAAIELVPDADGYWLTLDVFGDGQAVPRQRFEFDLITVLTFSRWVTRHDLHPLAAEFTHPAPATLQPYHDAFHCPVRFDAPANRLLFSTADLTLPLPTYNPLLVEVHDRYAGEYLDRLDDAGISHKIRELIVRRLPDGDPMRGEIANAMCMSERTLQRRLQEEGTSFHQLVDDTRRDLAHQYLKRPRLTLEQVAYLLGFTDQSTFCRACKRWFNMSPGQYRIRHGKEAPDSAK